AAQAQRRATRKPMRAGRCSRHGAHPRVAELRRRADLATAPAVVAVERGIDALTVAHRQPSRAAADTVDAARGEGVARACESACATVVAVVLQIAALPVALGQPHVALALAGDAVLHVRAHRAAAAAVVPVALQIAADAAAECITTDAVTDAPYALFEVV